MNERIRELMVQADYPAPELALRAQKFAELIVKECAQLARDTDLEDVEGGDSSVLLAAKLNILNHFGY